MKIFFFGMNENENEIVILIINLVKEGLIKLKWEQMT